MLSSACREHQDRTRSPRVPRATNTTSAISTTRLPGHFVLPKYYRVDDMGEDCQIFDVGKSTRRHEITVQGMTIKYQGGILFVIGSPTVIHRQEQERRNYDLSSKWVMSGLKDRVCHSF